MEKRIIQSVALPIIKNVIKCYIKREEQMEQNLFNYKDRIILLSVSIERFLTNKDTQTLRKYLNSMDLIFFVIGILMT